ncbi:hypothetical protein ACIA8K_02470 [Catenuloplanes sp. NPDC051500]|uniref:hypothetical protein n=1 Tax=Catenuloplanes sp. NPDC051500 TaxID=3363959 RepID=UPI0037AA645A
MAWFRRQKKTRGASVARAAHNEALEYLAQFVTSRTGVEVFIEPKTTVTEHTVILIAHDGEWTRRRIDSPESARRFAHKMAIPVYDIQLVGYPQRMRDYNERRKRASS